MLRLRLAADPANLQSREDYTAQDAVRIGSFARAIGKDRDSCRALALAIRVVNAVRERL